MAYTMEDAGYWIDETKSTLEKVRGLSQSKRIKSELENIGITANNKNVELGHEFIRAGIGTESDIKIAVSCDLFACVVEGNLLLGKFLIQYQKFCNSICRKKIYLRNGFIREAIERLCSIFPRLDEVVLRKVSFSEEEMNKLQDILNKYIELDKRLFGYNLRDNILPTLSEIVALGIMSKKEEPDEESINSYLQEEVVEDLRKLGLDDLLPQLREGVREVIQRKKDEKLKEEMQAAQQEVAQKYAQGEIPQGQVAGENVQEI